MNLWQAIKMAFKSLFSNKLRSFLTMLGIIIGVFTVSLLTTVASGVETAVVSEIRTQSTLAALMNMNTEGKLTVSVADNAITSVQPEDTDADDYFEYSLVVSSSSISASESLEGVDSEDIKDYLIYGESFEFSDEELSDWLVNDYEKYTYAMMLMSLAARSQASESSVYATSANYAEVYDLEITGRFPSASGEVAVDSDFVATYLSNLTEDEILGKNITLGIELVGTKISVTLNADVTDEILNNFITYLENSGTGFGLSVCSSGYTGSSIEIVVEYFKNISNSKVQSGITTYFETQSLEVSSFGLEDIYDSSNAKVYTIVGIITSESNSMFSVSVASDGTDDPSLTNYMNAVYSSTSGTAYILLDEENLGVVSTATSVDEASVSYIYFRFKTEDVMEQGISNLTVAFASVGLYTMLDFFLISMSSVASIISSVMNILTIMLTVISVISLIIGGIGIMNIMLVAVTERTREIGIRKAIGAKKSSILTQFLVEALMLSLVGGAIGLIISAIASAIIGSVMGVAMAIPAWVVLMSLGFCTAIGLIFGMFPAVKASNMQPIDALRRE